MTPVPHDKNRVLEELRICIAYDCLFPWTIGGAERWYRTLVERLAETGARVTYLTRRQWEDDPPEIEGVGVIAVMPEADLYRSDGTRKIGPPLRFGWGVFWWLVRHRSEVDRVRVANFPYFSLLAARAALLGTRKPLDVDWFEVWPLEFWRRYAGRVAGRLGFAIQALCIRLTDHAFVFWEHTATRLRAFGFDNQLTVLAGLFPANGRDTAFRLLRSHAEPVALFAGRMIKDKGVLLLPEAIAMARRELPALRLVMVGEGPEESLLQRRCAELDLAAAASFPGKVPDNELDELIASASCVVVASVREGYGLMVVEAAAAGTPSIVAANPENAATEHIVQGVNGFVVDPTSAALAQGILAAVAAGDNLRQSTIDWYQHRVDSMSMNHSAAEVVENYTIRQDTKG
jgi:glycosyltransferase involved in cell wall biosynthesis